MTNHFFARTNSKVSKYPELDEISKKISKKVIKMILEETKDVDSQMPYKNQYVLEELIKILQEKV